MILKKIGSIVSNITNKTDKNQQEDIKEAALDKKSTEESICSKDSADALKAAFIGGQNLTINTNPDNAGENDEYYTIDDDYNDDLTPEDKEFLHDMRTVGYVNTLLHKLYYNGFNGKELTIKELAQEQALEIAKSVDKNELESFISDLKEGMESIDEATSGIPGGMSEELIQEGSTLCSEIISLLENKLSE